MFRIIPKPTFTAAAPITVPGEPAPVPITIEWRHLDRDKLQQWLDDLAARKLSDVDGLALVIVQWSGVCDEAGLTVPFSPGVLRQILTAYHSAGAELVRAYVAALTESRLGN